VRVLDSLIEQVHGAGKGLGGRPEELDREVELQVGDVRDEAAVKRALEGVDSVVHLAAEVGVGQSMYEIDRYTSVNELGTAVLFQKLIEKPVRRVVVASSMSIYGEGMYLNADGELDETIERDPERVARGLWDPVDRQGRPVTPTATPESKRGALASVYAIGKFVQERLTLTVTHAYGMEGAALRLWNAYGPGQALSNPYTGVLAIFAARLLGGQPPLIFEDGEQRRDFVHAEDVAQAFLLALDRPEAVGRTYNIGSGVDRTVTEVARSLAKAMGREEIEPAIAGGMRKGDIRHCFPDLTAAETELGYKAVKNYEEGLAELAEWVARQQVEDKVAEARKELERRGLVA
ncbi:MAG: NAD-dependent epimerase/dehydratase family protein, partial [Pseudomonadota bacterium]|nr:NAD-dependent epimerase/dehydratase family protein [Pseudomonadota bacterium]